MPGKVAPFDDRTGILFEKPSLDFVTPLFFHSLTRGGKSRWSTRQVVRIRRNQMDQAPTKELL